MPTLLQLALTNLYLFVMAVVLALVEIQIEGEGGWAKNLPTYHQSVNRWIVRVYSAIMSGKEMTVYHISIFTFVLLSFHLPYMFGLQLTWNHWLQTMSLYFLFLVVWDFLWFVMNPHYSIRRFNPQHVWWHRKWTLGMPVDYLNSTLLSFAVIIPLIWMEHDAGILAWWFLNASFFALFTFLACLLFLLFPVTRDQMEGKKMMKEK